MNEDKAIINLYIKNIKCIYKLDSETIIIEKKRVQTLLKKIRNTSFYQSFPFNRLNNKEKYKVLHHMLFQTSDREFFSNMKKMDINRDYEQFIIPTEDWTSEKNNSIELDIKSLQAKNRLYIRKLSHDREKIIKKLSDNNDTIFRELNSTKNLNYFEEYLEYCIDGISQWINYRIIATLEPRIAELKIQKFQEKIKELQNWVDHQSKKFGEEQKTLGQLSGEETCGVFASFLKENAKYSEYIEVVNVLIDEIEKDHASTEKKQIFKPVHEYYQVSKELIDERDIRHLKSTITEGKKVDMYSSKLKETIQAIIIFNTFGGRDCYPTSPQDIKVYFREIFMSKVAYRKKNAMSIIRAYIKEVKQNGVQHFDNQAHYLFIREKISRGYFREKGNLKLYILKSELQKALYQVALTSYQFYDYKLMINFLYTLNSELFKLEQLNNEL